MIETTTKAAAEHKLVLGLRIGVVAVIVCLFLWRIFGIRDPAHRFFDDFFYYLVPAEHWVDGAGPTFFPGEPTNGYHPLWFLWVALLYGVLGGDGIFFAALDLSLMALMIGFYFLFERFLRRVTGERLAAAVGAAVASLTLLWLARGGLETASAVCAAALLLCYLSGKPLAERTVREAAVVGFLAALVVLARLDATVLLLGLAVAVLPRWDSKRLAALAAGAAPVYLYVAFNMWVFGHLASTSMAAKTLDVYLPPNWWFLEHPSPIVGVGAGIVTILIVASVAIVLRRSQSVDTCRIALALLAAPVLQFAAQALFSGWMLFPWYAYLVLMVVGLAVALLVVQLRWRDWLRPVGTPLGAITLAMGLLWIVLLPEPESAQADIASISRRLLAFSLDHPGVYAIGDTAGTPGWMLKQPVVQMEGLVMSHAFLDRIRLRQPMDQVFRDYHVTYYVASTRIGFDKNSCHEFLEPNPAESSFRAPHMAMMICAAPVAEIPGTRTRPGVSIFRIDPATGRAT